MKAGMHKLLMPLAVSAGSFLALALLVTLTSPLDKIAYAIVFFIFLFIFLVAMGYLVTLIQMGRLGPKSRGRIVSVSIFLVVLLMFRSAGTLSWVGGLILLLIAGGWLFYASHRA